MFYTFLWYIKWKAKQIYLFHSVTFQLFICSLAFATFTVELALPQNRLQLSFILLLTTITFKFVVSQTLPRISYLTYLVGTIFFDVLHTFLCMYSFSVWCFPHSTSYLLHWMFCLRFLWEFWQVLVAFSLLTLLPE